MSFNIVTCAICDDTIPVITDGKLRYCRCHSLGIDCTKEYCRYLGTIPKEHTGYNEWFESKKEHILKARAQIFGKLNTGTIEDSFGTL